MMSRSEKRERYKIKSLDTHSNCCPVFFPEEAIRDFNLGLGVYLNGKSFPRVCEALSSVARMREGQGEGISW